MLHTRFFPCHRLALVCLLSSASIFSFAQSQCEVPNLQLALDLADAVSLADSRCYSSWFSASTNSLTNIYSESSLLQISNLLNLEIARYRGESEQARKLENLGEFVRAAYYVRYNALAEDFSRN